MNLSEKNDSFCQDKLAHVMRPRKASPYLLRWVDLWNLLQTNTHYVLRNESFLNDVQFPPFAG